MSPPPSHKQGKVEAATEWVQQEVEEVFSKIARYTQFVLFGKWALGSVALLILVSLIAWPLVFSDNAGMRISFSTADGSAVSGSAPVMENPRYQGTDKKGQPYIVVAERAIQQTADTVLLEALKGELSTQDQKWLHITAKNGAFDDIKKQLTLMNGVVLKHQDGHVVVTERALLNTETSVATGEDEVQVQSPIGSLLATGFEIRDNGAYMKFGTEGRVKVDIKKSQQRRNTEASS